MRKLLTAVLAGLLLVLGTAGSAHAQDIDKAKLAKATPAYATYPLKANSVGASQLTDNSVGWPDLGSPVRQMIRDLQGPIVGNQRIAPRTIFMDQLAGDARKQTMEIAALPEPKIVTNIGGPINTQGTHLGLGMKLGRGSWLVTISGQVNRVTEASKPGRGTQPQLSLWLDRNGDGEFTWKTEGDISPNATIPDAADRSATMTMQTVVTVNGSDPLPLDLVAHGYNGDKSDAGSGELAVVNALITAVPIAS